MHATEMHDCPVSIRINTTVWGRCTDLFRNTFTHATAQTLLCSLTLRLICHGHISLIWHVFNIGTSYKVEHKISSRPVWATANGVSSSNYYTAAAHTQFNRQLRNTLHWSRGMNGRTSTYVHFFTKMPLQMNPGAQKVPHSENRSPVLNFR